MRDRFPPASSLLQRYAAVFSAVEINSSFHRPHRPATYARWAGAVPKEFRFAVKLPRALTHDARLVGGWHLLEAFLEEAGGLGDRLGVLLVQLPPSLDFNRKVAGAFFDDLRKQFQGFVACEPRHSSWFGLEAENLLRASRVARVAADPAVVPEARVPGGWTGLSYWRLHGSPRRYYSAYSEEDLVRLGDEVTGVEGETWCIFDNTAAGAATGQALDLVAQLAARGLS
ncbi:MAG: DUF72 domain-containing protein [Gemmatimonadales bacterium]